MVFDHTHTHTRILKNNLDKFTLPTIHTPLRGRVSKQIKS